MGRTVRDWWKRVRIQQKIRAILLVVFIPLLCSLALHIYLVRELQSLQLRNQQLILAREQVQVLNRLALDIEDAFRGYLLTHQEKFLKPLHEAEPSLEPTTQRIVTLLGDEPALLGELESATQRLRALLESKHVLIDRIRENRAEEVVGYVRSGQGLALSDAVRNDLRQMEDQLRDRLQDFKINENRLAGVVSVGLIAAVGVTFAFGLLLAGLLSGSITRRVGRLQTLVAGFSSAFCSPQEPQSGTARPGDEIDDLARSFEEMSERLRAYLRELEALNTIGHEISTIHADGLHGVLKRITDRAVELLQVDGCLLMLRNNEMGCWIVEAASDPWEERLHKAVMLWEEFPVSVRAFETRGPAIGEELQEDQVVQGHRRQVIGNSVLSVPLLFQGEPFGVLVFILQRPVPPEYWNTRLAKTFADEAAVAIANARLYDTAHRKEKAFESRLKQLLSQAEILAHDMKAPSERMRQLATILCTEYGNNLDSNATRWLRLMEGESRELSARIQSMLEVARVGVKPDTLEAVDPALVIQEVLKETAGELERRRIRICVPDSFPMVACHRAYLRQVFDNLIGNAVKFAGNQPEPEIRITIQERGNMAHCSVHDNGPGIPMHSRTRVFDPFVRLCPGEAKGSGIGLTIVKRIVELYGGEIWIEPNDQPGCTVTFSLPILIDWTKTVPEDGPPLDSHDRAPQGRDFDG